VVMCSSQLIRASTGPESRTGIERLAPVVRGEMMAVTGAGGGGQAALRAGYPREVLAVRDMRAGVE
jgi:hypothetical protein